MSEEWNLTERIKTRMKGEQCPAYISRDDVKEFIRRLKDDLDLGESSSEAVFDEVLR